MNQQTPKPINSQTTSGVSAAPFSRDADCRRIGRPALPRPGAALSPQQTEVLRRLLAGDADKEIAHRLGIAIGTVKSHLAEVRRRAGVHRRVPLALWAINQGIEAPP